MTEAICGGCGNIQEVDTHLNPIRWKCNKCGSNRIHYQNRDEVKE
jgi:hypothetical protein